MFQQLQASCPCHVTCPPAAITPRRTARAAAAVTLRAQELNWIDTATRAVVWDVFMYNANTDNFHNLRVLFEFNPGGIMAFTPSVAVHNLNMYPIKT